MRSGTKLCTRQDVAMVGKQSYSMFVEKESTYVTDLHQNLRYMSQSGRFAQ